MSSLALSTTSSVPQTVGQDDLSNLSLPREPLLFLWVREDNAFPFRGDTVAIIPRVSDFDGRQFELSISIRRTNKDTIPPDFTKEELPAELIQRIEVLRKEGKQAGWSLANVRLRQPSESYETAISPGGSLSAHDKRGELRTNVRGGGSTKRAKSRIAAKDPEPLPQEKEQWKKPSALGKATKRTPLTLSIHSDRSGKREEESSVVQTEEKPKTQSGNGSTQPGLVIRPPQNIERLKEKYRALGYGF